MLPQRASPSTSANNNDKTQMPNKIVTIQLHSVEYGGDNLGDDIAIDLNIGGVNANIRGQLKHGATRTFDRSLSRFQSTNNSLRIAVSATVTEEDIVYNDVGLGSGNLTVDLNGVASQSIGSVTVSIPGSGGDKGDTGVFTLNFTAKLEEVYRFVPDVSRGWMRVRVEATGRDESLPYTVAVSYTKTERRREYFTIRRRTSREECKRFAEHERDFSLLDCGPAFAGSSAALHQEHRHTRNRRHCLTVSDDHRSWKFHPEWRLGHRNPRLPTPSWSVL